MIANLFGVYDAYYKWSSKVAEDIATGMFGILNKFGIGGAASNAVTNMMPLTPLGFAAVKSGLADGNVKPTSAASTTPSGDRAKAILDVIKSGQKTEREKAADTKGQSGQSGGTSATSVSGSVIGVGQNPVVSAIHEQTELAKQSVEYLRMLATKTPNTPPANLTEKGGTPVTPATSAPRK
jgi:hypothetical protein